MVIASRATLHPHRTMMSSRFLYGTARSVGATQIVPITFLDAMPTPPTSPVLSSVATATLETGAIHSPSSQTATSTSARGQESPLPHAARVLGRERRPSASLQKSTKEVKNTKLPLLDALPVEVIGEIVNILHREEPKAIRQLAGTSRSLHAKVVASGKPLRYALCFKAENAWRHPGNESTILEEVVVAANAEGNGLTSDDTAAILGAIKNGWAVNLKTAEGMIVMAERLDPAHRGRALPAFNGVLKKEFGDDTNAGFYNRLAILAKSAQTDEDKVFGLALLQQIYFLPAEMRMGCFDELAPLWETIVDDDKRTEGLRAISVGLACVLPPNDADATRLKAFAERFEKYARLATSSIDGSENKKKALSHLVLHMHKPRKTDRLGIFCELANLVHSIDDTTIQQQARLLLRPRILVLPEDERANARGLLETPRAA